MSEENNTNIEHVENISQNTETNFEDSNSVTLFGADIQKQIAELAHRVLQCIEEADVDEMSDAINQTVSSLDYLDGEKDKKFLFFSKRAIAKADENKRYDALKRVESMEHILDKHRVQLLMDGALYDQMYKMSQDYLEKLGEKISVAKTKIEQMKIKAKSLAPEEAKWMENTIMHIERRVEELEIAKVLSTQQSAQIHMLQDNAANMARGIQSTLYNVIPLWKNQVSIEVNNAKAKKRTENTESEEYKANKMLIESLGEISHIHEDTKSKKKTASSQISSIVGENK